GDLYKTLDSKIADGLVYDYINLANVLEHVRQPIELLEGIKKLMHPKTLLRIIVPNDFSLFQNLLVKKGLTQETWFVPPDHLNYFTFDSLTNLLNARGLQTFKVISDFPVEAFLFNEHSNYWSDRSRGKQAHLSRVTIENFLINQGIDNYINYREAAAKCDFGRSVIAFTYLAST
ncbi:MAG: methyltransferase domain-containing protein, partial [Pseudanabaena sp.]